MFYADWCSCSKNSENLFIRKSQASNHLLIMAKRSHRRSVRYEKDHSGCMWGLISIFDFRNGRSSRKLLSDRRHGSKHGLGKWSIRYGNTNEQSKQFWGNMNLGSNNICHVCLCHLGIIVRVLVHIYFQLGFHFELLM